MTTPAPLLTIDDYEARAKESMPRGLFDRFFGELGAPDWATNTNNVAAFDRLKLRPRVLVDVSQRELSIEALGTKIDLPIILAPVGTHQRSHPLGELASARAAGSRGTIMALSTPSTYSIEEVAAVASGPLWFQLDFFIDRKLDEILVRRAENAGYTGLVLTVDNLGAQSRVRQYRYPYMLESEQPLANFIGIELPDLPTRDNINDHLAPSLTWSDLQWLRSITSMPLIIKGIQTAEDGRLCVDYGADALVVSNHGGHALEGSESTLEMLPEIVDAVGDGLEVYMDGGIRRGTDVLKALALGAKAVLIGRPIFWGLSVNGEEGVGHVLDILREELSVAMGLCGVSDLKLVTRNLVNYPDGFGQNGGMVDQLERLVSLHERGYLTREEFETQKTKLLG